MQPSLFPDARSALPPGAHHWPGGLSLCKQSQILDDIQKVLSAAPAFRPRLRNGVPMINTLTNCGALGWLSDEKGYRYEPCHPKTGKAWPPIPDSVLTIARMAAEEIGVRGFEPDACLVNVYARGGKLNLHRDEDEADKRWPIISLSFGSDAIFVLGGPKRADPVQTISLHSGDVLALHGPSRMRFHGVRRLEGSSPIAHPVLPEGGRINLTLRRAA